MKPSLSAFLRAAGSLGFLFWFYFFALQCLLVIFAIALIEGNVALAGGALVLANLGFFAFAFWARKRF